MRALGRWVRLDTIAGVTELLEVGSVGRAHGLGGEVSVDMTTNVSDRLFAGATFVTDLRVLVVEAVRPHKARWLVRFEGVIDRTAAESLHGLVLRAEPLDGEPEEGFWIHDLIGSSVVDVHGNEHGHVASVEANPASDLLVLDSGALVPLHFVVSVDSGTVEIDPPDGLFDL